MMVGALGLSVAGSVFCWVQIVNDIMLRVLKDSWQLVHTMVQSYMITWLAPFYGQYSVEKQAVNPAKDGVPNVEVKIGIDEECPRPDSGMDSPPVSEASFEEQDKKE